MEGRSSHVRPFAAVARSGGCRGRARIADSERDLMGEGECPKCGSTDPLVVGAPCHMPPDFPHRWHVETDRRVVMFTDHERVVAEKDARIKELEGRVEAQRRELSEWVEQDAMWRGMVRRLEATIEEATNE